MADPLSIEGVRLAALEAARNLELNYDVRVLCNLVASLASALNEQMWEQLRDMGKQTAYLEAIANQRFRMGEQAERVERVAIEINEHLRVLREYLPMDQGEEPAP